MMAHMIVGMDKARNIKELDKKEDIRHFKNKIMNLDMKEVEAVRDLYAAHFTKQSQSS